MIKLQETFDQIIQQLSDIGENEFYKLQVVSASAPAVLAGIDSGKRTKQIFLDLGKESWEDKQINSLPRWRGMSVKIEKFPKLFMLKDHYFLVFSEEDESGSDIFIQVMQNLFEVLSAEDSAAEQNLYNIVYRVLDKWKNFFQRGGFRRLSDEEQRGLFGELWFINEWLDEHPDVPPLIVEQWEGPTKGRIDFKNSGCGLEVKTVIDKLSKTIKISNENQLKLTSATPSILLYVCFLELSKTHGTSLQTLTETVKKKISQRSERIALEFSELLWQIGYKEEDYAETYYFIEKIEIYEAGADFPRINKEELQKGISHVTYNIDLTHCTEFEIEKDLLFKQFRLDG